MQPQRELWYLLVYTIRESPIPACRPSETSHFTEPQLPRLPSVTAGSPPHSPSPRTRPLISLIAHADMVSQRDTLVPLPRSHMLLHRSLLPLPLAIPRKRIERHCPRRSRAHHPATRAWCRRDLAHFPRSGRFLVDDLGVAGLAEGACWVKGVEGDDEVGYIEGAVERGCMLARFPSS